MCTLSALSAANSDGGAEGLNGAADADKDGFIKTTELADYVDNEVPELAEKVFKHKQYPVISPSGQGFPLVRVR